MKQQFFTHNYSALQGFINNYIETPQLVVDPYAGEGHLLRLFENDTDTTIS